MTKPILPSLSEDSWVFKGYKLLDRLVSSYLTADKSQGQTVGYEHIRSFQYTLLRDANDIPKIISSIHEDLTQILSPIFEDVEIEVVDETEKEQSSSASISIFVEVVDPYGERLNLNRLFSIQGSKFVEVTNITGGVANG